MITPDYIKLMASYNHWQNMAIVAAAGLLSDAERHKDRGAFFGSIFATMNHLLWGDQMWLHRLAGTPLPRQTEIRKSAEECVAWSELVDARARVDRNMLAWSEAVVPAQLSGEITWVSNVTGKTVARPRTALVVQLFNHGTHHRGQINAMLTACGAKLPDTDLQYMPGFWDDQE